MGHICMERSAEDVEQKSFTCSSRTATWLIKKLQGGSFEYLRLGAPPS